MTRSPDDPINQWSITPSGPSLGSAATPAGSGRARPAPAPEQVDAEPEHEDAERLEGHPGAVVAHVGHRRLAVLHRQDAEREIADAAADGEGDRQARRADPGRPGQQDEDLERRR